MRTNENSVKVIGYLYSHNLQKRKVERKESKVYGQEFISGNIDIAVDEDGLNVIRLRYSYVTPTTSKGNPNRTYGVLEQIIKDDNTWQKVGKDNALKVSATGRLAANDFVSSQDGQMVENFINEGSFISIVSDVGPEDKRNEFIVDAIFNGIQEVENDDGSAYINLKGYAFNFRNELIPIKLAMRNPEGIQYFQSLEPSSSNIVYTKVWGPINSLTIEKTTTEETAFGAPRVITSRSTSREWLIENAAAEPYEFDDENTMTADELRTALQNRQIHLAEVKAQFEARKTTVTPAPTAFGTGATTPTPAAAAPSQFAKKGNFNF